MRKAHRLTALLLALLMLLSILPAHADEVFSEVSESFTEDFSDELTESIVEPDEELVSDPADDSVIMPEEDAVAEATAEPVAEPSAEPTAEPAHEPVVEPTGEPSAEPTAEPAVEPTSTPVDETDAATTAEPTVEPTAEPSSEPAVAPAATPCPDAEPSTEPVATPVVEEKATFVPGLGRLSGSTRVYEYQGLWGAFVETTVSGVVYAAEQSSDERAVRVIFNNGTSLWEGWVDASSVSMFTEEQTASYDQEERDEDLVRLVKGHALLPITVVSSEPTGTPEPVTDEIMTDFIPLVTLSPEADQPAEIPVPESTDAPAEEIPDNTLPEVEEEQEVFVEELPEATMAPLPEPTFTPDDSDDEEKFMAYRSMSAPENLTASHNRLGLMTLRWDATDDADAYQVLYKASNDSSYKLLVQTTKTSYSTSEMDPTVVYYFRVQGVQLDSAGKVINQSPQSASLPYIVLGDAAIKDPRGKDTSTIRLEWSRVEGANLYDVMMSIHGKNEWSIVRTDLTGQLCDIANISFDETYDFRVIPKRRLNNGTVITGNSSRVIMVGSPMETPSFQQYDWTENGLKLTWDEIPGASGYVIYRRPFSETDVTNYTKLVVLDEPVTTYVDTAMEPGEVYYYFVYSFKTCQPEGWRCFSLKGEIGMGAWLPQPQNVAGQSLKDGGVRLEWNRVTGASHYDVHISTIKGQTPAADGRVTTPYGFHKTAIEGRTYYYRVRAVRVFSNGDVSMGPWTDEYVLTYEGAQPTYRALVIGNTYPNADNYLPGCDNDAYAMKSMLSRMGKTPYSVNVQLNLSNTGIVNAISSTFASATDNDVSLFYFSGHGANSVGSSFHGALVGTGHTYLSVARLKEALDLIPGKKIVIIDTCHSGQMIGKSLSDSSVEASAFNSLVISTFASDVQSISRDEDLILADDREIFTSDPDMTSIPRAADNLANSGYYVITAAHSSEKSVTTGYDSDSDGNIDRYFGLFTYAMCHGSGWNTATNSAISALNADTDGNGEITLYEAYVYAKVKARQTNPNQTAQMYPDNSAMVVWAK